MSVPSITRLLPRLTAVIVLSAAALASAQTPDVLPAAPPPVEPTPPVEPSPPAAPSPPVQSPPVEPTPAEPSPSAPSPETSKATPEETAALLAQLNAELEQQGVGAVSQPSLSLYGFADVGVFKYFLPRESPLTTYVYPKAAFTVGNLNLYLSSELGSNWRSLAEVRFTFLPNGSRSVDAEGVSRVDTTVSDYTNFYRLRQTGSIMLERAFIEYAPDPLLNLRLGAWLTPYGVWNEDHGSPTIIPVTRPYVITLDLLPERQTGLLIHGTTYASQSLTLGYAVGLSNGRGPVQDFADLDENKALTLRLHGVHRAEGVLTFGGTVYYGRYTNLQQTLALEGNAPRIRDQISEQYDQLSIAFDARYVLGGFHAQAELIISETAYTPNGRALRLGNTYQPDNRRYGAYSVIGYRFPWLGLMPYLCAEYFALTNTIEPNRPATRDVFTDYTLGVNSRPTDNVTLKLESNLGIFDVDYAESSAFGDPVLGLQFQVAWAF